MKILRNAAITAAAFALTQAASATVITYRYTGVTESSSIAGTANTFGGSFSYDTAYLPAYTVDNGGGSFFSDYESIGHVTFSSGSFSFDSDDWLLDRMSVGVSDNQIDASSDTDDVVIYGLNTVFPINDLLTSISMSFWDQTGNALASADWPTNNAFSKFIPLASGDATRGTLFYFQGVDGDLSFIGHFNSLSEAVGPAPSAVPEPAAWAMFIGGFCLIGGALRHRRQKLTVSYG